MDNGYFVKRVPKNILTKGMECDNLEISIRYEKGRGYNVYFQPIKTHEYGFQCIPHYGRIYKLTTCNRRSDKRMKEAIECFNSKIKELIEFLKGIYKEDFTETELKINMDC